jgi:hypothetical protein
MNPRCSHPGSFRQDSCGTAPLHESLILELKSLQVFSEDVAYWQGLQEQGEIESFEAVTLEPHGGELLGFVVMRGEREKFNHACYSDEFLRLNARAGLVINNFGVVAGFSGEALNRQFASFQEQASELT